MKMLAIGLGLLLVVGVNTVQADTFGDGANQFEIDFVTITANPGETRPTNTSGETIETFTDGVLGAWTDPGYNYRMGVYEITNGQWAKYCNVTGAQNNPYWTGSDTPASRVSWCEAAMFVNWLNEQAGKHAAYNFDGDGNFSNWDAAEAWDGVNLYRHKDAYYFLPDEDEWVKAAYWNGTCLQTYATQVGECLSQGDGVSGIGWNYYVNRPAGLSYGPWSVGSGSEELNGTYDMMSNMWEWMESPYTDASFGAASNRALRGGAYGGGDSLLASSVRAYSDPGMGESYSAGFRVASAPEPASALLVLLGAGFLKRRKV